MGMLKKILCLTLLATVAFTQECNKDSNCTDCSTSETCEGCTFGAQWNGTDSTCHLTIKQYDYLATCGNLLEIVVGVLNNFSPVYQDGAGGTQSKILTIQSFFQTLYCKEDGPLPFVMFPMMYIEEALPLLKNGTDQNNLVGLNLFSNALQEINVAIQKMSGGEAWGSIDYDYYGNQYCGEGVDYFSCDLPSIQIQRAISQMKAPYQISNEIVNSVQLLDKTLVSQAIQDFEGENYQNFGAFLGEMMTKLAKNANPDAPEGSPTNILQPIPISNQGMLASQTPAPPTPNPTSKGSEVLNIFKGIFLGFIGEAVPAVLDCFEAIEEDIETVEATASSLKYVYNNLEGSIQKFENEITSSPKTALTDMVQAIRSVKKLMDDNEKCIDDLPKIADELEDMWKALESMASPWSFAWKLGENLLVNGLDIAKKAYSMTKQWKNSEFEDFGKSIGDILEELIIGDKQSDDVDAPPDAPPDVDETEDEETGEKIDSQQPLLEGMTLYLVCGGILFTAVMVLLAWAWIVRKRKKQLKHLQQDLVGKFEQQLAVQTDTKN